MTALRYCFEDVPPLAPALPSNTKNKIDSPSNTKSKIDSRGPLESLEAVTPHPPSRECSRHSKHPGRFARFLGALTQAVDTSPATQGSPSSSTQSVEYDKLFVDCDRHPHKQQSKEAAVSDRTPDALASSENASLPSDHPTDSSTALHCDSGQPQKNQEVSTRFPSVPVRSKSQNARKKASPRFRAYSRPVFHRAPKLHSKCIPNHPKSAVATELKSVQLPEIKQTVFKGLIVIEQFERLSLQSDMQSADLSMHHRQGNSLPRPQRNTSEIQRKAAPKLQRNDSPTLPKDCTSASSSSKKGSPIPTEFNSQEGDKFKNSVSSRSVPKNSEVKRSSEVSTLASTECETLCSELEEGASADVQPPVSIHPENSKKTELGAQSISSKDKAEPECSHSESEKRADNASPVPSDPKVDVVKEAEPFVEGISSSEEDAHKAFKIVAKDVRSPLRVDTTIPKAFSSDEQSSLGASALLSMSHEEAKSNDNADESRSQLDPALTCEATISLKSPKTPSSPLLSPGSPQRQMGRKKSQELEQNLTRSLTRQMTTTVAESAKLMEPTQDDCLAIFNSKERSVMKNYFEVHDTDGSGTLCISELLLVLDDIDRIPKEGSEDESILKFLFEKSDEDRSGELDFEEFLNLIQHYYHGVYFRVFNSHDEDKSGNISVEELGSVLEDLKQSGFLVEDADAESLFADVDSNGDGSLSFDEFCDLMERYRHLEFQHLEQSAGFTPNQLEHLHKMFDDADEDSSGALDLKEIVKLLEKSNLGKSLDNAETLDEFVEIFSRMDKDRSATLDFLEFIRLLRVWDKESCRPDFFMQNIDSHAEGKLPKAPEKQPVLGRRVSTTNEMEWDPIRLAEKRAKTEMVADSVENRIIHKHHKLSLEEIEALRENFVFSDTDGNGNICEDELQVLLKNCGSEPSTHIQKDSLQSCLEDIRSKEIPLDFVGVVRLCVEYHERCASHVKKDSNGRFPIDQLVVIFYQLGQYLSKASVEQLLLDVEDDLDTSGDSIQEDVLKKMLEKRRIQRLYEWRSTYGFKEDKIAVFKNAFEERSFQGGDRIPLDGVGNVVKKLGYDTDQEERNIILQRFTAHLRLKHEDQVSWSQFLLLLKQLENLNIKLDIKAEHEVAEQIGLDEAAFRQVRQLFKSYDDNGVGKVSKNSIRSLFSTMGVAKTQEQRRLLRTSLEEIEEEGLGFGQFLRILKHLDASGGF